MSEIASEFDFQSYLDYVRSHYAQSQGFYTPTDAILPLQVQSVTREKRTTEDQDPEDPRQRQKVEQFPVLEGLRRYALGEQREHVLLAGRPGAGKSMALRQLVVQLAAPQPPILGEQKGAEGRIPVLVQLKGDRPVVELIQAEFRRAKVRVTAEQIDQWLLDERLILLLDGVNEIPTEVLRRSLAQFREDNPSVPMVLTTRDLAIGGDLGIEKRFEMKPLSPEQLREFVGKRLGKNGDRLLSQLDAGMREIAETPLLLTMLCDVFDPETEQIPHNKSELFEWFDRDYERIKKDIEYVPVSENFWLFKSQILQYLAFRTIEAGGNKPDKVWYSFPRDRAVNILEEWLLDRGMADAPTKAAVWIKDLVNYHLLQEAESQDKDEIEFHHQSFQEYYASKLLLKQLEKGMDDETLECEFLNLLKWTETVGLMLGLVEDERLAIRLVEKALRVDLILGARLAGAVRSIFHQNTIEAVCNANTPDWLKIEILGYTKSDMAIQKIFQFSKTCSDTLFSLARVSTPRAISIILQIFNDPAADFNALKPCMEALYLIENLNPSQMRESVDTLLNILGSSEADIEMRFDVTNLLGLWSTSDILPRLLCLAKDCDPDIRSCVAEVLGDVNTPDVVTPLIQLLQDNDFDVRHSAEIGLSNLTAEYSIPQLLKLLHHKEPDIRSRAVDILADIGTRDIVPLLIGLLGDEDFFVRYSAADAVGKLATEHDALILIELLEDYNPNVRSSAAKALGNIDKDIDDSKLWQLLHQDPVGSVRLSAAGALSKLKKKKIIPFLLELAGSPYSSIRYCAAYFLGNFDNNQESINVLLKLAQDPSSDVCEEAIASLGKVKNRNLIVEELCCGNNFTPKVQKAVIGLLGTINSDFAVAELVKLVQDSEWEIRNCVVIALGNLESDRAAHILPDLLKLLPTPSGKEAFEAIQGIQANCKFYNYEIYQKAQARRLEAKQKTSQGITVYGDYIVNGDKIEGGKYENLNATEVKIFEKIQTYHASPPRDPPS